MAGYYMGVAPQQTVLSVMNCENSTSVRLEWIYLSWMHCIPSQGLEDAHDRLLSLLYLQHAHDLELGIVSSSGAMVFLLLSH